MHRNDIHLITIIYAQTKWYVKTTGTADVNARASWFAATTLPFALTKVVEGDSIFIAKETYIPQVLLTNGTNTTNDKCSEIKHNISLIGGFPNDARDGSSISNQ